MKRVHIFSCSVHDRLLVAGDWIDNDGHTDEIISSGSSIVQTESPCDKCK